MSISSVTRANWQERQLQLSGSLFGKISDDSHAQLLEATTYSKFVAWIKHNGGEPLSVHNNTIIQNLKAQASPGHGHSKLYQKLVRELDGVDAPLIRFATILARIENDERVLGKELKQLGKSDRCAQVKSDCDKQLQKQHAHIKHRIAALMLVSDEDEAMVILESISLHFQVSSDIVRKYRRNS